MLHKTAMGKALGIALREAREAAKLTQDEVALMLGISRAAVGQWESGKTDPSTDNLIKICKSLDIDLLEATNGRVRYLSGKGGQRILPSVERAGVEEVRRIIGAPPPPNLQDMPSDVPVRGVAVGGADGYFLLNGEVVDYVKRPPGAANARALYAIYVIGNSMSPRFEPGDLVYVNPARPPQIGDYVVVQMMQEEDGGPIPAMIKRLVKRGPPTLLLEQFNPEGELRLETEKIHSVHRVVPWTELIFGSS